MSFFADLHGTDARLGGKARSLARLAAAGLRTPTGFAITDELFRAIGPSLSLPDRIDDGALAKLDRARIELMAAPFPAGFSQELAQRLAPDALWSVRSSFASEDVAGSLGAGVYESRVAVRRDEVETAIRQVLASALSAGAVAYALAHGLRPAAPPLSVLVHPFVRGEAEGGAACVPEHPDDPIIQVRAGTLAGEAATQLRGALRSLVQRCGAVEVEWVGRGENIVFLQMRPFAPLPAPVPWRGWDDLEAGESRAAWQWDQAHNPLPLSPVHAGLIALVDQRCRIGIRQRVLGQYLFYALDTRPGPAPVPVEDAPARFAALRAEVESRLTGMGDEPALEEALDLLLAVEEPIFGIIQPALRMARANLEEFLRREAPSAVPALGPLLGGVKSMASERRRRAAELRAARDAQARAQARDRYLDLFGDETPVWDVAVPTCREAPQTHPFQGVGGEPGEARSVPLPDGERPPMSASAGEGPSACSGLGTALLSDLTDPSPGPLPETSEQVEKQLALRQRGEWRRLLRLARQAAGLGEDDDWLYARVQAALRRALLSLGRRLHRTGALSEVGAVFFLPLPLARSLAAGTAPPADLAMQAAVGRVAWEAACLDPPPAQAAPDKVSVKGVGTGGRALGRVVLHRPASPRMAPGQILVAATLLPSELPLLVAAALVTETGGPLDHVASQARERHLPAVVGAAGACRLLRDGDLVLVDADRGLVVRLG
jgi:phosphohistidine swiveling domain-containing protein